MSELFYNAKNLIVSNGFLRNPNRYYLEEFFNHLPSLTKTGTVTQSTDHTAEVSLNANSGIIQLAAVALDVTTNAEFTFTNNVIKTTSQILLTMQDENTTDNTQLACAVHTIANGSCKITIVNPSSNSTSATASKIHFKIINKPINDNFLIAGTNSTDSSVTFSSTGAGIKMATLGGSSDQVIIFPTTDTNASAWTNIKWGTENEVEWDCAISITSNDNVCFWTGLKLTNTPVLATDNNQAYFFFDTDTVTGSVTSKTTLHFCYSVSGIDYVTDLGITVEENILYRLRISIDNNRKISVFVNETQYGLTTTSSSTGVTVSNERQKSNQLTDDIDLIPYVGVQETTASIDTLTLYYQKISRLLFE